MTCLWKILDITRQKHIPDTKILARAFLLIIYAILMQTQLLWAGHITRMKDHRLSKKLLNGELSQRKRSIGGQKKRFKETLKWNMKSFGIAPNYMEYLVQDREKLREVVKHGAKVCETRRNAAIELRKKLRKGTVTSATATIILCSQCTQIGLISDLRTHRCLPRS